jgi:hypothetical protein
MGIAVVREDGEKPTRVLRVHGPNFGLDHLAAAFDLCPNRLAESITGHSSGGSDFNTYGTVGYTLEQKKDVLRRIAL